MWARLLRTLSRIPRFLFSWPFLRALFFIFEGVDVGINELFPRLGLRAVY